MKQDEPDGQADDLSTGQPRSPMRIFVREILDHNTSMDLETGQLLTRKVRQKSKIFFSKIFYFHPTFSK